MDLFFSDISQSFAGIMQQELPKEVMGQSQISPARYRRFADNLEKEMNSSDQTITVSSPKTDAASDHGIGSISGDSPVMARMIEKVNGHSGTAFISSLRKILQAVSNGELENIEISPEGLDILKKLLMAAGFNESDINELVETLSEEFDQGTITMDAVFDKLFDLEFDIQTENQEEVLLDVSAAPFFESILISLGVTSEDAAQILSEAGRGDDHFSLDALLETLGTLRRQSFFSGQNYTVSQENLSFASLVKGLGLDLDLESSTGQSFSLDDVIRALETLRADLKNQSSSQKTASGMQIPESGSSSTLMTDLFDAMTITEDDTETAVFSISSQKAKNKQDSALLSIMSEGRDKTDLSVLTKDQKQNIFHTAEDGAKEIEDFLESKAGKVLSARGQQALSGDGSRQHRLTVKESTDQIQAGALETKQTDTLARLGGGKNGAQTAKNLPNYVTRQVGTSLVRAINQGETSLRVQLKPPELGRLMMTIDNTGGNMRISIITENQTAREILTQNITELKNTLSNSGVNLERFEVDMSSDFRQSMADARHQSGQSKKQNRNKPDSSGAENQISDESIRGAGSLNLDGTVHLVA